MEVALQLDDQVHQMHQKLKDQELSLQHINQDEIQIIGNPKGHIIGKLLFTFFGILVVAFSLIFSQGQGMRSLIFMIIGFLIGMGLIVIPFYTFYSKKQFRIFISRLSQKVEIKHLTSRVRKITFDEIKSVCIKVFKMDDYVNDETDDSTTFYCKFSLKLQDNKEIALFTFSSREHLNLEKFSNAYGKSLADFIGKPLEAEKV